MKSLYLDFETRWQPDIKKVGAARCVADPTAGINCMAYAIDNSPVEVVKYYECSPELLIPLLVKLFNSVDRIVAHKAIFEILVLKFILNLPVHLPKWACTMAKCAYYGYPRNLGDAGKALQCKQLKDVQGKAAMLKLVTGLYTPETASDDFNRLYSYCANDIYPMREIDQKLPHLPDQVQEQWELDVEINLRGVPVDVRAIRNACSLVAVLKEKNNAEMSRITDGYVETIGQTGRLVAWLKDRWGIGLIDCTADTVERALQEDLPEAPRKALALRQAAGLASLAKYQKMLDYQVRGRLYDMFDFYGAHTGRPTGSGPQVMNPPRGEDPVFWAEVLSEMPEYFYQVSNPDECLKEAIRGVISVA